MKEYIANKALRDRVASPAEAARLIGDGMTVAMGGYSQSGYPKAVPRELKKRQEAGEDFGLNLITGANVPFLDDLLGGAGLIRRRAPMCASRVLAGQINAGRVEYVEQQMNKMPGLLRARAFGRIEVAVVEALGLTEEGFIVPTSSVGAVDHLVRSAERVIVEINTAQPRELEGLHDIYDVPAPPDRRPIPLWQTGQRIGRPVVSLDPERIAMVVHSQEAETAEAAQGTPVMEKIIDHLFNFLELEFPGGRAGGLPPIQTGFGGLAVSLARSLGRADFSGLQFFCGGVGEAILELLVSGQASAVSTGGIEMSPRSAEIIAQHPELMRERCVIRNLDVTNSGEIIGRLGLMALNTGIEADIYGNVNSSHIGGSRVVNGLGGGANFAQNAGLSVMLLPSLGKGGQISTIVPMVSHQDISEHDIDVLITENGLADLRGLSDLERARAVIANCADESFRDPLTAYLEAAIRHGGGHHPQLPEEAWAWHRRLKETGSMRF